MIGIGQYTPDSSPDANEFYRWQTPFNGCNGCGGLGDNEWPKAFGMSLPVAALVGWLTYKYVLKKQGRKSRRRR